MSSSPNKGSLLSRFGLGKRSEAPIPTPDSSLPTSSSIGDLSGLSVASVSLDLAGMPDAEDHKFGASLPSLLSLLHLSHQYRIN